MPKITKLRCIGRDEQGKDCGKEMKVVKYTKTSRDKEAYSFRCPYCGAMRVLTQGF